MRAAVEGKEGSGIRGGARAVSGGVPARFHYVVARRHRKEGAPDLLRVEVGSGEEAMPVFLSGWSAHNFVFSNGLEREWRVREHSPGELASLLVTLHAGVDWVLLDPPSTFEAGGASTSLTHRENFLEYLVAYPGTRAVLGRAAANGGAI